MTWGLTYLANFEHDALIIHHKMHTGKFLMLLMSSVDIF